MKNATAIGCYLVGTEIELVRVTATPRTDGQFAIDLPKDRGKTNPNLSNWEREMKIRVRASLAKAGIDTAFSVSFDRTLPFYAPLDLAIFAACMGTAGKLSADLFVEENPHGAPIFCGELSMQGEVRPVRGILPMLRSHIERRMKDDERGFVVPYSNRFEAEIVDTGTSTYIVETVSDLLDLPAHTIARIDYREPNRPVQIEFEPSFFPMRVVDALVRAAIEREPIHLIGSRAFSAAQFLHSILPMLGKDEAMETAAIHSISGMLQPVPGQIGRVPFRAPHHTVEARGMVGGDIPPRPGEASLAHNGMLVLDSLPQFKRGTIEALSSVLKEGKVRLWRRDIRTEFPTNALLVTTAERCPCIGEKQIGKHSEFCATRGDRKTDPIRDECYTGWQTRFTKELGIETIVDVDFADGDEPCMEGIEAIRKRVAKGRS